jgi:hypothetical protein
MITDTAYNLKLQLQRIDEKMKQLTPEKTNSPGIGINLKDEREVTQQCLRVCEDARSYVVSLSEKESILLQTPSQDASHEDSFEAQERTRQFLDQTLQSIAATMIFLQKRLEKVIQNDGPENDSERMRLQADIDISKQCLNVCEVASEISRQKVYRVGEVIAGEDSDQVVANTLSDLFDVKRAVAKDRAAQLITSTTDESLRHIATARYGSRFGAVTSDSVTLQAGNTTRKAQQSEQEVPTQAGSLEQTAGRRPKRDKPSPNQMRKRTDSGDAD